MSTRGEVSGEAMEEPRRMDAAEHLVIELARLRAKFSADPAVEGASLDDAWTSPTAAMEEDEAEFLDAVADCLGVGLSLDEALDCWDAGGLVSDDDDGDAEDSVEIPSVIPSAIASHPRPNGRRVVVA
jgi:hypothetical protein